MTALTAKRGLSLVEYVRERRKADCPVCALSDDLRDQLAKAGDKKIKRSVVIAWLAEEHGIGISEDDISSHVNSRHDRAS